MLNFGDLRKYIYFPRKDERAKEPYAIFVLELWGRNWIANRDAEKLLAGEKNFYAVNRTQPYSDELWEACQDWAQRRDRLADEFKKLMEKGIGKS